MEINNGKFRKRKICFTQVSNVALRDNNLSLKAKGLYALIGSYISIEGFTLYKTTLLKGCKEGQKAFESAWKELKDLGYLIQYKLQGEKGKFFYEYELLDEPEMAEKSHTIHIPKKEAMDSRIAGKGTSAKKGGYNNTDLNNTDLNNTDTNNTTQYQSKKTCSNTNDDILISSNQAEIIENNTHLKLSKNQMLKTLTWDILRLKKAIEIFKEQTGRYFALLEKIYNDNGNFVPKVNRIANNTTYNSSKHSIFANFKQREYDYDKLEKQLLGWDSSDDDYEIEISK